MKKRVSSLDGLLREQIATTILVAMTQDAEFAEPKCFAKWQRAHKDLLVGLFGGQGVQNLARVVAWCRREALQVRREQIEVLCLISEAMRGNTLPTAMREALADVGIVNVTDLLRTALLDPTFARSVLEPATGGLDTIITAAQASRVSVSP